MKKFFLTTAIDYANGRPHIGHAYEKILADVISRIARLSGKDVYFLTGLDEHGQKVEQSAINRGVTPKALCDEVADDFKALCSTLNISYDHYIRTTDEYHRSFVQKCLQQLFDAGEIYKAEYTGIYSLSAERFVQEKDKVDGEWPADYGHVTEITETNYFFRLKKHQRWLIDHIETHPDFVYPKFRAKQVLEFLKEPINDLCISRPKERLSWGIELPFDKEYVTYVWFDALLNYVSGTNFGDKILGDHWPADYHIIGKDILVPAHSIYWPIMLHVLGYELPKTLLTHGWWLLSGEKMSKSSGNIVDPLDYIKQFGPDPFRYYLMREMNVGQDCDFNHDRFVTRYTTDLGNDLGNLLSRIVNMLHRYCKGIVPGFDVGDPALGELRELWNATKRGVLSEYQTLTFNTALERLFAFISFANKFIEQNAPWKLAKSPESSDQARLKTVLAAAAESVRLATLLLAPVMPSTAPKILSSLGATPEVTWNSLEFGSCLWNKTVTENVILFPRWEQNLS
ncbi:MAG: methionine--tRNA ligase [Puniceicoccales bacterium]|jgi:methionyl-tRNA synthetase|nr:methionine--tRNA ligase [Puniceicoccales bacterium]